MIIFLYACLMIFGILYIIERRVSQKKSKVILELLMNPKLHLDLLSALKLFEKETDRLIYLRKTYHLDIIDAVTLNNQLKEKEV
ncbi:MULTISPECIES: hypothetical protein [Streptococcus]|uniref:hypothetical protein n=1 Tax=Streptococcus TaxID=1301 RepID=UPI00085C07FF|nr:MULTISPECIES: hypothetical protein [Streptococcus]OHQ14150.1 hypothetical protein HMPREF2636_02905 [Streptococcus sp. HMSC064H02]HEN0927071.1 hypothetical protein [Streptococcus agalactiae]